MHIRSLASTYLGLPRELASQVQKCVKHRTNLIFKGFRVYIMPLTPHDPIYYYACSYDFP
jgi:hypothetical protein